MSPIYAWKLCGFNMESQIALHSSLIIGLHKYSYSWVQHKSPTIGVPDIIVSIFFFFDSHMYGILS